MSIITKEFEVEGDRKEKLKVMFDSASSQSFIRKDAAEKIGFVKDPRELLVTLADGNTIRENSIGISHVKFDINGGCLIQNDLRVRENQLEEIVIGVDIMQNRKLIIDMDKEDIDTSKCWRYMVA